MITAIDPGPTESAYATVHPYDFRPMEFGKVANHDLLNLLTLMPGHAIVIEQISHYGSGMPAGMSVFDTCRWIGRFEQRLVDYGVTPTLIQRREVKLHLCGSSKAKDGNVIQALVDRFAPGERNRGKGTKAEPGFFFGFAGDQWQAYALGVYAIDKIPSIIPSTGVPT